MNKELKEEIFEHIEAIVNYGFSDPDYIYLDLEFLYYNEIEEEIIKEEWLTKLIEKRYNKRLELEKHWPEVTDFDRLAKAFDELHAQNIISLHFAGYTTQEGEESIYKVYNELKDKGIEALGYCYYHIQDVYRAVDPDMRMLYIRYNDFLEDDDLCQKVGNLINEALIKHGLTTHWSGSIYDLIEIRNIHWQKRHTEVDYRSAARVVEAISSTQRHQ
jgi:hypothetical protein